jgi:hypothetical protein
MELRVRETGSVITESEFRSLYPNTSFPKQLTTEILDARGIDVVFEGPQASTTPPYEISVRQGVEEINGKWFTKYVVGPVFTKYTDDEGVVHSAEEQEAAYKARIDEQVSENVRTQRNKLLEETDWTQFNDSPLSEESKLAWQTYRQELRDITTQEGFPHNIIWPTKPVTINT